MFRKRTIRINNFKSLDMKEPIEIKRLTFIFGKNGSGKSNFIRAIRFMGENLDCISKDDTVYNLYGNTNLINYKETVFKNDLLKNIAIEFQQEYEHDEEKLNFSMKCLFQNGDNRKQFSELVITDIFSDFVVRIFPNKVNDSITPYCLPNGDIDIRKMTNDHPVLNLIYNNSYLNYAEAFLSKAPFQNSRVPSECVKVKRKLGSTNEPDYLIKFWELLDILPFYKYHSTYALSLLRALGIPDESLQFFIDYFNTYIESIPSLIKQFFIPFYAQPIRNKPDLHYPLQGGKFATGSYYELPNRILNDWQDNNPFSPDSFDLEFFNINLFINNKLKKLRLAQELKLEVLNSIGTLYIIDEHGTKFNLSEASSGLLHILPILIQSYNAGYLYENALHHGGIGAETDVVIVEQPELHLHPSLQASLAEFFAEGNNTFIIETHSEHMIRKIQVLIARGKLNKDHVAVYYFDKSEKTGVTKINKMEIEDNGNFKDPWPGGFFDEASALAYDLLDAQLNRNN